MAKRPKTRHTDLRVIFDTNAIYTGSASFFLRKEVVDSIEAAPASPDLTLHWIIPDIVRAERHYQMLKAAASMLPTIDKLERLLGHNLNITAEILDTRVEEAIRRQVERLRLTVQPLAHDMVNWQTVINDSAFRRPPFDPGEKEKGFRDAIVVETFLQVVSASPKNPSTSRVCLVSADSLLGEAARNRLVGFTNVHFLDSMEALRGLINTLASSADETFIDEIKDVARKLFFVPRDENTLYYKTKLAALLDAALRDAPLAMPTGAETYRVEGWTVNHPSFAAKDRQKIRWNTRVTAKLSALKAARSPFVPLQYVDYTSLAGSATALPSTSLTANVGTVRFDSATEGIKFAKPDYLNLAYRPTLSLGETVFPTAEPQVIGNGTAHFDVSWETTITTNRKLTKPTLLQVSFVEALWG